MKLETDSKDTIEFSDRQVIITKKLVNTKGKGLFSVIFADLNATRTAFQIPLADISSVFVYEGTKAESPFIQILRSNEKPVGFQSDDRHSDPTVLLIELKDVADAKKFKAIVEQAVLAEKQPTPNKSVADEIAHMAEMYRQGLVTEAEFVAYKRKLLS